MADYGITSTGFVKKTLAIIVGELNDSYRTKFGNAINVNPPSNIGVQIGISADREAKLWDLFEETYNSRARSTAQGVSLDNAGELVAVERLPAKASQVLNQLFFGVIGTVVPTSLVVAVQGNPAATFSPTTTTTLVAGTNEVQKLTFSTVPDAGLWNPVMPDGQATAPLAFNASASAVQTAVRLLAGWDGVTVTGNYSIGFTFTYLDGAIPGSAGNQPLPILTFSSTLTTSSVPVSISHYELTLGVVQGSAIMSATLTGVVVADAEMLNVINTPVTGLTATSNTVDAVLGSAIEKDSEYRLRTDSSLQSTGAATIEAMRTAMKSKVAGVLECIIYQNDTDVVDGASRPPHSLQFYVQGGDDVAVATQIFKSVAGGIQTDGEVTEIITDSQGLAQTINFSRPILENVYVIVNITKDPTVFTDLTGVQTKNAVEAFGQALQIGQDVLVSAKLLPAIADAIAGIISIQVLVGFAPSPTLSNNLTIAANQIASFDTSRITVNIS